jgi:hypothetical protein
MPADPTLSVVVLFERAVHLPGLDFDFDFDEGCNLPLDAPDKGQEVEWSFSSPMGWTQNEIVVENTILDAFWKYADNTYYVPFRAVLNVLRLGDTIVWDGKTRSVTARSETSEIGLTIGSNEFIAGDVIVMLDQPAVLIDGVTYVPFRFFRDVFGKHAWVHEGQVVISSEGME